MLKITYGNQCVCVCVYRDCRKLLLIIQKVPLTQHVFTSNSQCRVLSRERKISPCSLEKLEIRDFIKQQREETARSTLMVFLSVDCDGFLKKTDKTTVALWKVHLLVLFIF